MAAPKFWVGDKVIGTDTSGRYTITTKGWVGYVIDVESGGYMEVDADKYSKTGMVVMSQFFELYEEKECPEDKKKLWYVQNPREFDTCRSEITAIDWGFEPLKIKPKKSVMTKVSEMFKRLLDSDTQALVKAGFLDETLELTSFGQDKLDAILFSANKAALVELANEKLAKEAGK